MYIYSYVCLYFCPFVSCICLSLSSCCGKLAAVYSTEACSCCWGTLYFTTLTLPMIQSPHLPNTLLVFKPKHTEANRICRIFFPVLLTHQLNVAIKYFTTFLKLVQYLVPGTKRALCPFTIKHCNREERIVGLDWSWGKIRMGERSPPSKRIPLLLFLLL